MSVPPPAPAVSAGPRLTKFHQVLQLALDRTLDGVPLEAFLECFPGEIVEKHRALLVSIYESIAQSLEQTVKRDFEAICAEYYLADKLNRLDDLIISQPLYGDSQRCPLPSQLTPQEQVRKESHELKSKEKEHLVKVVKQLETENTELRTKLQQQQHRQEQLVGSIAQLHGELEKSVELTKSWDSDQLRQLLNTLPKTT